jgi:hypothetical protein
MRCRFCGHELTYEFINLGNAPPSNAFLTKEELNKPEVFYPLKLFVCGFCFLVQIDEYKKTEEIFNAGYAYFSSFSRSWLEHAKYYAEMMIKRFNLDNAHQIIEVASNDGYLLQYFKEMGIPCLGIEPTEGTAKAAREKDIETIEAFFGTDLAKRLVKENRAADLLIGNNVLAHVPDLNNFVSGLRIALKPQGIITMEFPHLLRLIDNCQFDTIYHEHFSYFSLFTVKMVFEKHGLEIFDVEELPTHGGSLRIYAKHVENVSRKISTNVPDIISKELASGIDGLSYYQGFQKKVEQSKADLLEFLVAQKKAGRKVAAYGAAAKGNTLLNYCGIKKDLVNFVVDISPHKQGRHLPGSHIPIVSEEELRKHKPDYVLILPWNIEKEIVEQLQYVHKWGGRLAIPTPDIRVL